LPVGLQQNRKETCGAILKEVYKNISVLKAIDRREKNLYYPAPGAAEMDKNQRRKHCCSTLWCFLFTSNRFFCNIQKVNSNLHISFKKQSKAAQC